MEFIAMKSMNSMHSNLNNNNFYISGVCTLAHHPSSGAYLIHQDDALGPTGMHQDPL